MPHSAGNRNIRKRIEHTKDNVQTECKFVSSPGNLLDFPTKFSKETSFCNFPRCPQTLPRFGLKYLPLICIKCATDSSIRWRSTYFIDSQPNPHRRQSQIHSWRYNSGTWKTLAPKLIISQASLCPLTFKLICIPLYPPKKSKIDDKWFESFLPLHTGILTQIVGPFFGKLLFRQFG